MNIVNKDALDDWLFVHANQLGHPCVSIKGPTQAIQHGDEPADMVNIAWVDTITNDKIDVIYGETKP